MTALAFSLALQAGPPSLPAPWRLVSTPALHVGLRPAAFVDNEAAGRLEVGVGVTLQVTR